jgi:ankyrin repeat protein
MFQCRSNVVHTVLPLQGVAAPLHYAATRGDLVVVEQLLLRGASVDAADGVRAASPAA